MGKDNCWEFKECGCQPGGLRENAHGACPAAVNLTRDGKNGGQAAGRYCWKIAGTLCDGEVQGTFSQKMAKCTQCDFFKMVRLEEGAAFEA